MISMFSERSSVLGKIKEAIHPTPLRDRVTTSIHRLKVISRQLERRTYQLQSRDKAIHEKCVSSLQVRNNELANIYANECAEIRKIARITLHSQLALEQVTLRLSTVKEFGDMMNAMTPVVKIVGIVKTQIQGILPELSMGLSEVNESLQDIVEQIGETGEESFDLAVPTEESEKILNEASVLADQKMKEKFPDLPAITAQEAHHL